MTPRWPSICFALNDTSAFPGAFATAVACVAGVGVVDEDNDALPGLRGIRS